MREEENRSKKMEGDEKEGREMKQKGNQRKKERKKGKVWMEQKMYNKC